MTWALSHANKLAGPPTWNESYRPRNRRGTPRRQAESFFSSFFAAKPHRTELGFASAAPSSKHLASKHLAAAFSETVRQNSEPFSLRGFHVYFASAEIGSRLREHSKKVQERLLGRFLNSSPLGNGSLRAGNCGQPTAVIAWSRKIAEAWSILRQSDIRGAHRCEDRFPWESPKPLH